MVLKPPDKYMGTTACAGPEEQTVRMRTADERTDGGGPNEFIAMRRRRIL